jgi:hypothetical protein
LLKKLVLESLFYLVYLFPKPPTNGYAIGTTKPCCSACDLATGAKEPIMPNDPNANPNHNEGLAQPNPVARLEASQQVPNDIANLVAQQIPLRLIRPNPTNRLVTPDMVDDMAASLKAVGLKNAVKMRPLPDGTFDLFSGHVRLAGAAKLGWETIAAYVMDITPQEAVEIGILDNRNKKQTWLDNYIDIEKLQAVNPKITLQELAGRLNDGVGVSAITRGKRLLKCLNPASRALINQSITKSRAAQAESHRTSMTTEENKGKSPRTSRTSPKIWELTEDPVYRLTDLEDPELVFKALLVLIDRQLTADKAAKLVAWVQAGNPPETFTGQKTTKDKKAPGLPPEAVDQLVELAEQVGIAKGRGEDPTPAQDKLKAFRESLSVGGKPLVPSYPITSPEGLAILRKSFEQLKALFKPASPETGISTPPVSQHTGQIPHPVASHSTEKHWFKKLGKKVIKLPWKEFSKAEHEICKKLARAIVSSRSSSHSGSSHRSGRAHSHGSFRQGLITLFLMPLHGLVYFLLQYGLLFMVLTVFVFPFAPRLKPLLEWPFRFAAHLALYDFPSWVWACVHHYLLPTLVIGGLLAVGFYFACVAEPLRMLLLSAALAYLIFHGRGWSANADMALVQPNPAPSLSGTGQLAASAQVFTPVAPSKAESIISKIISHPASKKITSPASAPQTPLSLGLGQPNHVARQEASQQVYQPSIAFNTSASPVDSSPVMTLYDPKLLEQEIAALPKNCIVKAYPVSPDETIPGDLAVSRMQGVTDPDKYTLMINGAKQKIISITATTTNLILNYKNADAIGNFFSNGGGVATVFWEDVLYIHSDEIDVQGITPLVFYQCSLIASGAKNALTFQCNSANDLKHLVSTMEFFIRSSRLGHDTALAGMPYPAQGVRLNNDCLVEKLWADSPMADAVSNSETAQPNHAAPRSGVNQPETSQQAAGARPGEMIWSVDTNAYYPPDRKKLETSLAGLTPGVHNLFVVSHSDWDKAQSDVSFHRAGSLNPRRRKVILNML